MSFTANSYKRRKTVLHWDLRDFSAFIRTKKITVEGSHYQLLDDYQAKPQKITDVFMGKILCGLNAGSPSEGHVLTTTKQQRYSQNNESQTSAAPTQPGCFPNSSFLLIYALTDSGTACTSNGTCDLQKQ